MIDDLVNHDDHTRIISLRMFLTVIKRNSGMSQYGKDISK
ncbi:8737_t:CDS:2 [Entrophospora sp. SA101]|nr:8737_t:CDS:2 [Entrophospora sp. SA101]